MDTTHFGVTPTQLCTAILNAWSSLELDGQLGTGCVRTIGRLRSLEPSAIAAALEGGAPALLLYYDGGVAEQTATHGQEEDDVLTFVLVAVSGTLATVLARQDGGERDPDQATRPGVEDLQDWGRYLALRALTTAGAKRARTVRFTQGKAVTASHFVATVTLQARRTINIYDDTGTDTLLSLGLCHDPTNGYADPDTWFTGGPPAETPVSDWEPTTAGGVTDL